MENVPQPKIFLKTCFNDNVMYSNVKVCQALKSQQRLLEVRLRGLEFNKRTRSRTVPQLKDELRVQPGRDLHFF